MVVKRYMIAALVAVSMMFGTSLVAQCSSDEAGVIVTFGAPGPCSTPLACHTLNSQATYTCGGHSLLITITDLGPVTCDGAEPGCAAGPARRWKVRLQTPLSPGIVLGQLVAANVLLPGPICHLKYPTNVFGNVIPGVVQSGPQCDSMNLNAGYTVTGPLVPFDLSWVVDICGEDCTQDFGATTAGSWGTEPRIATWGPTAYMVSIGTPFFAVLLEDVALPNSLSQPFLLLSTDTSQAWGLPLPLDLQWHGAPGFELLVSPDLILAPTPPTGPHHAEVAFSLPNDPLLVGMIFYAQWVLSDPTGNPLGAALTKGAVIQITP